MLNVIDYANDEISRIWFCLHLIKTLVLIEGTTLGSMQVI